MVTKPSEEVAQIASEARIGIVLRTKDRPTMLTRALEDILAQRFDSWVAVVVNDGGDADAVDEVVERFHDRARGRISTIHHPNGLGRSAAANAGVHGVTTDYVVLHDDDDLWDPGFLEATAAWLDAHPGDGGVVARTEIVYERETTNGFEETGRVPFWPTLRSISYAELLQVNRFVPIAYLYRRRLHDEVGDYREDIHAAEDWEFNLRVAARYPIGFLGDKVRAYWMQRPTAVGALGNSMFVLGDDHDFYDRMVRDQALRSYVAGHGDGLPLFLARYVQDEVARQLDERRTVGQRLVDVLRRRRQARRMR
ncbi:glycosyltransferase family A protein [uncultured Microbacterium sp.]|uniref:glycosyltransferase family 2 protein n=1 Tax=uncultured Microbacterium sp. TaxID=191216 RepID=UPI0025ED3537|nr:glycosyltransferase family A protein [uncultured Microbacterium sp.]